MTIIPLVDAPVICPAKPIAVELNTDVFENVPTVIPISDSGLPVMLATTMLFSELVISICLSDSVAVVVDVANTWVFKSLRILLVASTATVVVANPNLPIAPEVTSTISKLWFVLVILIVPVTIAADTPVIPNAFICATTLVAVGSEFDWYVPDGIPNSDNAVPEIIIEDAELDITILLPTTVQVILVSASSSVARLSSFES